MSKLDEKQIEKTHKSAAGQEDKAFEEWVSKVFDVKIAS